MMVSHRLYQDLRDAAEIDYLTNIYNRRATQQILIQQFNQFKRYNSVCSLILLDIDYFKMVNDNYGHETGDKVLQSVTSILKTQLRKTDTLGRWGGEEFLCVLPNTNKEKATEVAEKLRNAIARNKIVDIACTISLGVKMFDKNDNTVDEAIKHADDALYKAKHNGRNSVVAFA
jgi:diguanylate cyclase (GGDEF)-like protein